MKEMTNRQLKEIKREPVQYYKKTHQLKKEKKTMALFNEYQREENLGEPLVLISSHSPKNPNSIVDTMSSTFKHPNE